MTAKQTTKQAKAPKATKATAKSTGKAPSKKDGDSGEWRSGEVLLSHLKFSNEYQMRADPVSSDEYLQSLKDSGGKWIFPPLKVCVIKGTHYVVDGFTRGRALSDYVATYPGDEEYRVPVLWRVCTQRAALIEALGSNASHGYRRTNADKRLAVQRALGVMDGASAEKIAAVCCVSPPFVYRLRAQLQGAGDAPTEKDIAIAKQTHEQAVADHEQEQAVDAISKRLGKCPVCGESSWDESTSGYTCSGCLHPHGLPAGLSGDEDEDRNVAKDRAPKSDESSQSDHPNKHLMHDAWSEKCSVAQKTYGALVRQLNELGVFADVESNLRAIGAVIAKARTNVRG